jgi:cysteine desulfurase/selenocysteine lyase
MNSILEKKLLSDKIREDFPILNKKINGKNLVYFDNAATSQKPKSVIDSIVSYYQEYNSNVHRTGHSLGIEASISYENARKKVADFLGANNNEIIFTSNATESINLVYYSWGKENILKGDEIIVSIAEHHSNFIPWQQLAKEKNAVLKVVNINDNYELDLEHYKSLISEKTKMVAITMMSNVLGTITPIKEIVEIAHKYNAKVLVDASQSVPQMEVNVKNLDCDFLVFTGHKICGPTGIGVLYGKESILKNMKPFLYGGGMITNVTINDSEWEEIPQKFEAGTPKISQAISLGYAIDYITSIGINNIRCYEKELNSYLINKLLEIDNLKIIGPIDVNKRGSAVSILIDKIHSNDIGTILNEYGIAVRVGHHCAIPLHTYLRIPHTLRISTYFYNTKEEIDYFINSLNKSISMLRKFL